MGIIFFIFGLNIGSFLNVVIFRLRNGEKGIISGRSHCQSCKKELLWMDNIPLFSYLFLRGKCRFCKVHISWQYPVVEFMTSISFLLAYFAYTQTLSGVMLVGIAGLTAVTFAAMMVVFVYDLRFMEVPMIAIWIGATTAVGAVTLRAVEYGALDVSLMLSHGIAGLVAFLFFFSISYYSHEEWMGYGDGFIALVIGLLLGPLPTFIALLSATWIGAMVGIGTTIVQKTTMKSAIPFGPFLITGMFIGFSVQHFHPEWLHILW